MITEEFRLDRRHTIDFCRKPMEEKRIGSRRASAF